jgi:hypothetical protein
MLRLGSCYLFIIGEGNMKLDLRASVIGCLVMLACSGMASAQKLDRTQPSAVGDKSIYSWSLNNKVQSVEYEVTSVNDAGVQGAQRVAGKEFNYAWETSGNLTQGMCLSNGQQCAFSPGVKLAEFPLEKGRKWATSFTVKGETFTADVTQERQVDKIEKVKVPGGEYEAAKVSFNGSIKGTDGKGKPFTGKEDGTDWIAIVNGKPMVVKTTYRNSFGEKATHELVSVVK